VNRLSDETKLECKICWYVYDPGAGDELQQIPPGTPFLKLPDYWRCPQCDTEAGSFLPVNE
jgi:rubredoxin